MDLTLKTKQGFFNHRVAGVIIHENKLLAQKAVKQKNYYLPGGRIHFGESSKDALIRELNEELHIDVVNYSPLWLNECFFIENGTHFHEVGIYYLVDIENAGFCSFDPKFETYENGRTNHYEWLDIDRLNDINLQPEFIKAEIKRPQKECKLIISREE